MSLLGGPTLSIHLAEPFVFVTAPNRSAHGRNIVRPVLIRGLLVLKLPKATKITSIEVIFDGKSITKWPEGIGPRRLELEEKIPLAFLKISLLDSAPTDRRALSIGPGTQYDEYADDDLLRQFSRISITREASERNEPSMPLTNGGPVRTNGPQRAASALPGFERRTLQIPAINNAGPSPDPTPPYTLRPDDRTRFAQTPLREVAPYTSHSLSDRNDNAEHSADVVALGDRGRSFRRLNRETPSEVQHRRSYHEHSPGRYTDNDFALDLDAEDHPMPAIPEDLSIESLSEPSTPPMAAGPSGATVDVRSTPSTQPPSAVDSLDSLELHHWSSPPSSIGHVGAMASQDANATTVSLPALLGTTGSLYAHASAPVQVSANARSSLTVTQQNSIRGSSSFGPASPSLTPPSTPQMTRRGPSATPSTDNQQMLSPNSSLQNPPAIRTHSANRSERSSSRHGHGSRFSLGSMTQILREVSQDVRDAVGIGHHSHATSSRGRRSSSRASQGRGETRGLTTPLSLNRPVSLPEDQEPIMASPLSPHSEGFVRGYGHGGAGSGDREGTRSLTRDSEWDGGRRRRRPSHGFLSRMFDGDDDGSERRRGRDVTVNPLGDASHFDSEVPPKNEGWKEFRKGTYTYPISLAIPSDLPPSLACDFGRVSYDLSATVHRAGAFSPKLSSSVDVQIVSCLAPEATNDLDNIIVQRSWEDKLSYVVHVEGTAFPIGGVIPVNISLMPLDKISLYRVTLGIEEKIDYYAHGNKVVRRGPVQFHEAIQIRQPDMHQRLLPIISDSSTAAFGSPLAEYIHPEQDETPDLVIPPTASTEALEHTSDIVSHLLNPAGPWKLRFNVPIPDCHSHIHITNKVQGARIVVTHRLRITLRVSTGLAEQTGSNEKLKLFDIIVDAPVHLLSSHSESLYTHLPTYTPSADQGPPPAQTSDNRLSDGPGSDNHRHPNGRASSVGRSATPTRVQATSPHHQRTALQLNTLTSFPNGASTAHTRASPSGDGRSGTGSAAPRTTADAIQRSEQFERLVAGEESEAGEQPPAYCRVG